MTQTTLNEKEEEEEIPDITKTKCLYCKHEELITINKMKTLGYTNITHKENGTSKKVKIITILRKGK